MKYLYSIRDDLADDYAPIFEAVNVGVAVRSFQQLLRTVDKESRNDYKLVCVGQYDVIDGKIVISPISENQEVEVEVLGNGK